MSAAPAGGDKKNIVKMAYIYFQEGRWDKAIEEYKKLIALDPEDINTHNMLGDVYVKKGASREAFEEYIKVSADFSSRGQSDKAAIVNKKLAALDASLLPAEAQKKQNLIKQTIKAESAMEQGDVDVAIDALSEVLKLDSENLTAYSKLGELFEKKGKIPEAVKQYQMLGAAFLKNRLFKKALEMYQKVVVLDPGNVDARINLANISIKQGSESDAKKEFLIIAELSLNAGDMENANTYAAKAIEFKSIEAHYVLGMIFFKKQQFSEARSEFESLLRFKVNHVGALVNLGKVFLELNQVDKAAENIQKALKVEKDNLVALEAWVELSVKKGNKPEAITTLTSLLDRVLAKNDLPKAAELARNLTSLDENSIFAFTKLGEVLVQTGDKSKAADCFFKVALLQEKQGKKDLSAEFIRKTLELNPGHSDAQKRMMGEVVASASAPPPAPKTAETIGKIPVSGVMDLEQEVVKPQAETPRAAAPAGRSEANPQEELNAQIAIAENYVKQGLVEEAIEIYQQLIESHPDHPEIKEKLNQAYTAYVKTGDEVIGALEAEKKAKEDDEARLRLEMEQKTQEAARVKAELDQRNRMEAEKRVRHELEIKAREEAEKKAKEEIERMAKEEALKRARDEVDRKVREEAEKRAKEELEKQIREEILRKDSERRALEEKARSKPSGGPGELTTSKTGLPSKGDSIVEEGRDEFMTIAVADIYTRRGLYEEASKIYHYILKSEPDNLEARKKLSDLEVLMKQKGEKPGSPPETPSQPTKSADPPPTPPSSPGQEKDSDGKKKSSRVGYV